jgi:hypothetical protein
VQPLNPGSDDQEETGRVGEGPAGRTPRPAADPHDQGAANLVDQTTATRHPADPWRSADRPAPVPAEPYQSMDLDAPTINAPSTGSDGGYLRPSGHEQRGAPQRHPQSGDGESAAPVPPPEAPNPSRRRNILVAVTVPAVVLLMAIPVLAWATTGSATFEPPFTASSRAAMAATPGQPLAKDPLDSKERAGSILSTPGSTTGFEPTAPTPTGSPAEAPPALLTAPSANPANPPAPPPVRVTAPAPPPAAPPPAAPPPAPAPTAGAPSAPTAMPSGAGTGCTSPSHGYNGEGYGILVDTSSLRPAPYAACGTVASVAQGKKVWLWCSVVNSYNHLWWWVRIDGTSTYGWMWDGNLKVSYVDDNHDGKTRIYSCDGRWIDR